MSLAGSDTTRVHKREKRYSLPFPRGLGFKLCCRGEEFLDLMSGRQIGVSRYQRGFPLICEYISILVSVGYQPSAKIPDREPGSFDSTHYHRSTVKFGILSYSQYKNRANSGPKAHPWPTLFLVPRRTRSA